MVILLSDKIKNWIDIFDAQIKDEWQLFSSKLGNGPSKKPPRLFDIQKYTKMIEERNERELQAYQNYLTAKKFGVKFSGVPVVGLESPKWGVDPRTAEDMTHFYSVKVPITKDIFNTIDPRTTEDLTRFYTAEKEIINLAGSGAGIPPIKPPRNYISEFGSFFKKNKKSLLVGGLIAAGTVAAYSLLTRKSNKFSAKDDNHNTIEGLNHLGLAAEQRKILTDFGSGYQGLPIQLLGQEIDPSILDWRRDVWDNPEKRQDIKTEIERRQKEYQKTLGKLDFIGAKPPSGFSSQSAISKKNENLKQISLFDYNVSVEDADTLVLRKKGFFNRLFGKDISVRLSGIDAPEVMGHKEDPLDFIRLWQDQPGGQEATEALKDLLSKQKNPQLIVDVNNLTYGRHLGAIIGDKGENLNLELIKQGVVSALPFGKEEEDVISRVKAERLQDEAQRDNKGIWKLKRYRAIKEANSVMGRPLTLNTLTRLDKVASNLNIGAYASFLQELGEQEGSLSTEEIDKSQRFGRAIKKIFNKPQTNNRFSGQDDAYNTIEGLPHGGLAEKLRKRLTEFGSGWDKVRALAKTLDIPFERLIASAEFKKALSMGEVVRHFKSGAMGHAALLKTTFQGQEIQFVRKTLRPFEEAAQVIHENTVMSRVREAFDKDATKNIFSMRGMTEEQARAMVPTWRKALGLSDDLGKDYAALHYGFDAESRALRTLGAETQTVPSLYHRSGNKELYMEAMPGEGLSDFLTRKGPNYKLPARARREMSETVNVASKHGFWNPDIHGANVMYDEASGRISWIDQGNTEFFTGKEAKAVIKTSIGELMSKKVFREENAVDFLKGLSHPSQIFSTLTPKGGPNLGFKNLVKLPGSSAEGAVMKLGSADIIESNAGLGFADTVNARSINRQLGSAATAGIGTVGTVNARSYARQIGSAATMPALPITSNTMEIGTSDIIRSSIDMGLARTEGRTAKEIGSALTEIGHQPLPPGSIPIDMSSVRIMTKSKVSQRANGLRESQKEIWKNGIYGGRGHTKPAGSFSVRGKR